MSPKVSQLHYWKTLLAGLIPNGKRLNLYLPHGVLNVQSRDDSLSSFICQLPSFLIEHGEDLFTSKSAENFTSFTFHGYENLEWQEVGLCTGVQFVLHSHVVYTNLWVPRLFCFEPSWLMSTVPRNRASIPWSNSWTFLFACVLCDLQTFVVRLTTFVAGCSICWTLLWLVWFPTFTACILLSVVLLQCWLSFCLCLC